MMIKRLLLSIVVVAIVGCVSPNAKVRLALDKYEENNRIIEQDYLKAIDVLMSEYRNAGEKIIADDFIMASEKGGYSKDVVIVAFNKYRSNIKAFESRIDGYNSEIAKIQTNRERINILMSALKYYHEGANINEIIMAALTTFESDIIPILQKTDNNEDSDCLLCDDKSCPDCGGLK
ncbi:MAG TPA: hypothetical protein PK650_12075 [Candidatus Sumerlaeota bacterium]|nr:hypothetical protein [Candidatus Sumerlaeota bacterium]